MNNCYSNINNPYEGINILEKDLNTDLSLDLKRIIYSLNLYLEEVNEINLMTCNNFFNLISDNYNQIRIMPNELRITMITILFRNLGNIIAKSNKLSINYMINEKRFVNLIRIILKDLSIEDITKILYFENNDKLFVFRDRINTRKIIKQDSIYSLLALNKIISLIESKIKDFDFKRKLNEIKFILDFIFSHDNKYLKLLKFGKSFFNLGSLFKNVRKYGKNDRDGKEDNFIKKLFVTFIGFDESNIPLEIELETLSEENLVLLIHNIFNENLKFNMSSGRDEIKENISHDLSKLCNLYLLYFEKELSSIYYFQEHILNDQSIKNIDSRLNILEVCIVLLNKKKEYPIFKILSDISLAFFRSIYHKMKLIQISKLLSIISKDQFILFYDNSYFSLEFYPLIIMNINQKKNFVNSTDTNVILEIFMSMDKLNFFKKLNNNFEKHEHEEYTMCFTEFLKDLKIYFVKNQIFLNFTQKELAVFLFYIDVMSYESIESGESYINIEFMRQNLIHQANKLFFETEISKNNFGMDFGNLCICHENYSKSYDRNIDMNWDKYMFQNMFFFNANSLDLILSNLLFNKSHLDSSFSIFNQSKNGDYMNLDKCESLDFNYYEENFMSNKNKIIVKSFIYVLIKLIGIKKEYIEKKLKNITNLDIYNFLQKL